MTRKQMLQKARNIVANVDAFKFGRAAYFKNNGQPLDIIGHLLRAQDVVRLKKSEAPKAYGLLLQHYGLTPSQVEKIVKLSRDPVSHRSYRKAAILALFDRWLRACPAGEVTREQFPSW